ncbi:VCBS repeat-containing protein [Candidatus Fermentibacteria bacterium]|nr:VCBS repeat-containing protein [Candidatus Fermentibacteria bacterium]
MTRLLLLVPAACTMPALALDLSQTSWDSTGVAGPVREWAGGFQSSFGLDWQSRPGFLCLDRLGSFMAMGGIGSGAADIACGDIDGDGDADIAALEYRGRIVWYENPGDGRSFVIHSVLPAPGSGHVRMALLDADGDGDLDIAASSNGLAPLALYENQGMDLWPKTSLPQETADALAISPADVDADGDTDLVAGLCQACEIVWLENENGHGGEWLLYRVAQGTGAPWSVDAADYDRDGDADVIAAFSAGSAVAVFEQEGGSWRRIPVAERSGPLCAVFADVDGDGSPDAAAASSPDDEVLVFARSGPEWNAVFAGRGLAAPEEISAADFDGDGDEELAAVSGAAGELAWWESLGDGSFAPRTAGAVKGLSCIAAGDIDGDGLPEPVTGSIETGSIGWWEVLDRARSGSLTSSILYIGPESGYCAIEWDASIPSGTSARLFVRAAPSRLQMGDWIEVPGGRLNLDEDLARGCAFLQYRLELSSTDPSLTPVVEEVRVHTGPSPVR